MVPSHLDKFFNCFLQYVNPPVSTTCLIFLAYSQLSVIETYPQIIGYDQEVYKYFKEQWVTLLLTDDSFY